MKRPFILLLMVLLILVGAKIFRDREKDDKATINQTDITYMARAYLESTGSRCFLIYDVDIPTKEGILLRSWYEYYEEGELKDGPPKDIGGEYVHPKNGRIRGCIFFSIIDVPAPGGMEGQFLVNKAFITDEGYSRIVSPSRLIEYRACHFMRRPFETELLKLGFPNRMFAKLVEEK